MDIRFLISAATEGRRTIEVSEADFLELDCEIDSRPFFVTEDIIVLMKFKSDAVLEDFKEVNPKHRIKNIPVRYFLYKEVEDEDDLLHGMVDEIEVEKEEFMSAKGEVLYERHSLFANGSRQICLTKRNGYGG